MKTTLNQIRACKPCREGWEKLLTHLGKNKADDETLSITTILDSNGLNDALWCLQAVKGHDRDIRLFGIWCARQVQHLMKDRRSLAALDVAEAFANGAATQEQLTAAWAAAKAAAGGAAAWAAAGGAAAWAAAGAAAGGAAAWDAAGSAGGAAAWAAAGGAAAWDAAAGTAAWAAQANRLRELCAEIDAL